MEIRAQIACMFVTAIAGGCAGAAIMYAALTEVFRQKIRDAGRGEWRVTQSGTPQFWIKGKEKDVRA
jgi:hypothetical protein